VRFSRFLVLFAAALTVTVAPGCGGDSGSDTQTATTGTTTGTATRPAGGGSTTVGLDEFTIEPKDVTVSRGATLEVKNDGAVAHNLTIEKGPDPTEKSTKLAGTSTFLGGKSEKLDVNLAPGKYAMVCTVSGHRDAGMVGTITVK
jgi:plastocyanin